MRIFRFSCILCVVLLPTAFANSAVEFATSAGFCPQVQATMLAPIHLGGIKLRQGATGWLYLDGNGEMLASTSISQVREQPASAGVIELSAPDGALVHLQLMERAAPEQLQQREHLTINSLHLFGNSTAQVQQIRLNEFVVQMPIANEPTQVQVRLMIGLEAAVGPIVRPEQHEIRIQVQCVEVRW
jgi:hypothetical protein